MTQIEFLSFFKEQLIDSSVPLNFETKFKELSDWDSLTAMLFISNLKEEQRITLTQEDLKVCNTISDIYDKMIYDK
jgi:acyl carrier protein